MTQEAIVEKQVLKERHGACPYLLVLFYGNDCALFFLLFLFLWRRCRKIDDDDDDDDFFFPDLPFPRHVWTEGIMECSS